ncbi:MAG: DUF3440 domain-containing protein [Bacteroidia bacterium]|nr:DUF3440 domain-containing protein [Bacteroidia bacterium]
MSKHYKQQNVYEAAVERMDFVFTHFEKVYVSFSGGKDSGLMLHLALEAARRHKRLPLDVLIIDLEAQYRHTADFLLRVAEQPDVRVHWVCLPIHLRNAVSQYTPHWLCWDPDKETSWVRELPRHSGVISDEHFFPFFRRGMEFEEFVPRFGSWFAGDTDTACLVGIRSDESLNRFRTIKDSRKETFQGKTWSTKVSTHLYNFYPIYDWSTEDVWIANGKFGYDYNKIYDLMYLAGVPLSQQRLCQPFGDDQRKGLYLYKILEPETWGRVVSRVEGANFGNRYSENNQHALGHFRLHLPEGHTYESYAKFLLDTMPPHLKEHYTVKINKFIAWWEKQGMASMPDTADPVLEAQKKAPSWRRVCKVLLKNDYWCTGLSFGPTKRDMERQQQLILKYMTL